MTKQAAQAGGRQGGAAAGPLQDDEEEGLARAAGTLESDVLAKSLLERIWQGDDALASSLASNEELSVSEAHVAPARGA